jgi:CBFA2/RNUX1 translocation partner 1
VSIDERCCFWAAQRAQLDFPLPLPLPIKVKRQAVIEIQRAVAAAETRAIDMIAQERIKMEKIYSEMTRTSDGIDGEHQTTGTNVRLTHVWKSNKPLTTFCYRQACWNCGRKANETCSGCNLARYCGSFCQHKDWEQHHQACGTTAARSAAAESQSAKLTTTQPARSSANTNSSNSSSSRSSPTNPTAATVTNGLVPAKWRNKLMKPKKKYLC